MEIWPAPQLLQWNCHPRVTGTLQGLLGWKPQYIFQSLLNLCSICFPWIYFPVTVLTPFFPGFCSNPFIIVSQPPLQISFLYPSLHIDILHNSNLTGFFLVILNTFLYNVFYTMLFSYSLDAANCQIKIPKLVPEFYPHHKEVEQDHMALAPHNVLCLPFTWGKL